MQVQSCKKSCAKPSYQLDTFDKFVQYNHEARLPEMNIYFVSQQAAVSCTCGFNVVKQYEVPFEELSIEVKIDVMLRAPSPHPHHCRPQWQAG